MNGAFLGQIGFGGQGGFVGAAGGGERGFGGFGGHSRFGGFGGLIGCGEFSAPQTSRAGGPPSVIIPPQLLNRSPGFITGGGFGGLGGFGGGGFGGVYGASSQNIFSIKMRDFQTMTIADFARVVKTVGLEGSRDFFDADFTGLNPGGGNRFLDGLVISPSKDRKAAYDKAREQLKNRQLAEVQTGKLGVDLSVDNHALRNQSRLTQTAMKHVAGRICINVGGVWIDEAFDAKMQVITVKAHSDAYFHLLERHPKLKEVFELGNHLVWVTPSNKALVIDTSEGREMLTDEEIDRLFIAKK